MILVLIQACCIILHMSIKKCDQGDGTFLNSWKDNIPGACIWNWHIQNPSAMVTAFHQITARFIWWQYNIFDNRVTWLTTKSPHVRMMWWSDNQVGWSWPIIKRPDLRNWWIFVQVVINVTISHSCCWRHYFYSYNEFWWLFESLMQ